MTSNILTDDHNQVFYAVSVNGNIVTKKVSTQMAANDLIKVLSEQHQAVAIVVPVNESNQQVLLG